MTAMPPRLVESYWPAEPSDGVRDVTVGDLLREAAAAAPDRLALVDAVADPAGRREWTYAELLADVERVARALLARFERGDRIAIWAPNAADWVVLQQGIAMAGMVMVAINPAYRAHELQYVLSQSGSVALFHVDSYRDVDLAPIVEEVRAQAPALREVISFTDWTAFLASGDPALALPDVVPLEPVQIQYTSGTTGFPKGALLHHKGLVNEASFVAQRAGMEDGGVCINAMPMYHIGGGAVTEFGTLAVHGTYVVVPAFDPGLILELFETYGGTHSLMVPTMLIAVLEHPDSATRDMSSVQTIMSGASAVPEALVHRVMAAWGCRFSILFGQTEMHGVISQTRITDAPADQAATVGQPLPELEVKIADPVTGETLPIGEQGEICCRGYQTMLSLLRAAGGDRGGHRRRQLAAHGRPRHHGRPRLPQGDRPAQGHDHPRRHQHLSARDRGPAVLPPADRRGRRHRRRGREVGRAGHGGDPTGRPVRTAGRRGAQGLVQGADRGAQDPVVLVLHPGLSDDALGQGAEVRAA